MIEIKRGNFVRRRKAAETDYTIQRTRTTQGTNIKFDAATAFIEFVSPIVGTNAAEFNDSTNINLGAMANYEAGAFAYGFLMKFSGTLNSDAFIYDSCNMDGCGSFVVLNRFGGNNITLTKSGIVDQPIDYTFLPDTIYHIGLIQHHDGTHPTYLELVINGVSIGTYADTNDYIAPSGSAYFGKILFGGLNRFYGNIDEFSIYSGVVTAADFASQYAELISNPSGYQTIVSAHPSLVNYYKMDGNWNDSKGTNSGTNETTPLRGLIKLRNSLGGNKVDLDISGNIDSTDKIAASVLQAHEIWTPDSSIEIFSLAAPFLTDVIGFTGWNKQIYAADWLFKTLYSTYPGDNGFVFTCKAIPGLTDGDMTFKPNDYALLFLTGDTHNVGIEVQDPHSKLDIRGSFARKTEIISTDTTLDDTHYRVLVSGTTSITLPSAVGITGREYNIIRTGTDNVTIVGTINGEINLILTSKGDSVVLVADGTDWIRCS